MEINKSSLDLKKRANQRRTKGKDVLGLVRTGLHKTRKILQTEGRFEMRTSGPTLTK